MLIKNVKLENIRSYLNQSITFPEGATLLSGDIGSGKSTILLAIEFALFGIRRKHLSPASLLRHGSNSCSVELTFNLGNKDITIKRFLKRSKTDIKQESGYIIIDGIKKEATPVELKSFIIDILGYPKEMISRSRDLVYRYTVYTPQEEMKNIIYEDKEVRLDTLRKVFNIDKYKKIRENCEIYIRHLRTELSSLSGQISDIDVKKKQKQDYEISLMEVQLKSGSFDPVIADIKQQIKEVQFLLEKNEQQMHIFNELKNELDVNETNLKNMISLRSNTLQEIKGLESNAEQLKNELSGSIEAPDTIIQDINNKQSKLDNIRQQLKELNTKISQHNLIIKQSSGLMQRVQSLDNCPTCMQEVSGSHKVTIRQAEDQKIRTSNAMITGLRSKEKQLEEMAARLQETIDQLKANQNNAKIIKLKKAHLDEKNKKITELRQSAEKIKESVGRINMRKIEITRQLEPLLNVEKEYSLIRSRIADLQKKEHQLEIQKAELEKEHITITNLLNMINSEIKQKEDIRSKLNRQAQLKDWLEELFVNLVMTMEKHVLARIHTEFSELFRTWFNILIEDETISVRLDDEFTVVIEQDGYETAVANLSGGEKTAVALAYRLSLNKVINDIISQIRTKGLIILDEPTDGFSTEQLDKIRDVLEELNMKQVIIVSHENKIESFVDNVIRIGKDEHVSSIT